MTSTIPEIAVAIQVNSPYLRKVLDKLRDAKIVASKRGMGGGTHLIADPNQLTILDIVNAVDPISKIEHCPLGLPKHVKLCPLHAELNEAITQVETVLARRTLGELLATRRDSSSCGFPKCEDVYQL